MDLEQWSNISLPTNMAAAFSDNFMVTEFYIGLFGWDTTDFLYYCSIATEYCDYDTYSTNYDGWAIGSYWYLVPYIDPSATY